MPTSPPLQLRVFLASPGDVAAERQAARELMQIVLPKDPLLPCRVTLEVVAWDDPAASTPMPAHLTPQEAVIRFKTRPAACDIVLVILRARMGTLLDVSSLKKPDGSAYLSGTEWEFEDAWNATPRPEIMVYRCNNVPAVQLNDPQRKEKQAQYDSMETFLSRFRNPDGSWAGGINDFSDAADFTKKLADYLKRVIAGRCGNPAAAPSTVPPSAPVLLPYPSLGPLFKGRDAFMRRLRDSLTRPGGGTVAVLGMGGVGKTRAAVEYARAHRADYSAVALLDSETPDKLHSSLATLAGPLRLPAVAAPEEAIRVEAVLDWLNAHPTWLLILDNIDAEPALEAAHALLGRLTSGHVVLTSRLRQFPLGIETLDLDVLTADDATAFLLEATPGRRHAPDDPAPARTLADSLGRLALALEIAAATIETRGLGFAAYEALWQGNRQRVIGWADKKITGYHHAVAETWQTSVDQLTPAGRTLLERLCFLAPEPVPESLLDVTVPGVEEAGDPHAALDDLTAFSLATRDPEGGTFVLHRLVLDVTRRGLAEAGKDKHRLTEALGWMDAAFTGDAQEVRTWPILTPLAPHAEAVAGYADAAGIAEPTVDVMNRMATILRFKGLLAQAEPHYRRVLAIAESSFPAGDPRIAMRLNNLAQLLKDTNRLGEAEPLMRRVLGIVEASYGREHPTVATALNNLASLLQSTNRLGEAEPLMRRALGIDEASYGPDHPEVAIDPVLGSNRHHTIAAPTAPAPYYICHGTVTHHPRPDREAGRGIRPDRRPGRTHPAGTRGPGAHRRHAPAVRPRRDSGSHRCQASVLA
jgi:tetratricopeptide (TPR) repeat protein